MMFRRKCVAIRAAGLAGGREGGKAGRRKRRQNRLTRGKARKKEEVGIGVEGGQCATIQFVFATRSGT